MAEYRRFVAKTLEEAKSKMYVEMGGNAYIVKVNRISKKNMLGIKNEDYVEIQAGCLDRDALKHKVTEESHKKLKSIKIDSDDVPVVDKNSIKKNKIENLKNIINLKNENVFKNMEVLSQKNSYAVEKELDNRVNEIQEETNEKLKLEKRNNRNKIISFLSSWEFEKDFIEHIVDGYDQSFDGSLDSKKDLSIHISKMLTYAPKPKLYVSSANMIILIGSTGVGKSTTLAKMGAEMALSMKKKTVFCTFDIKRIMATVQLEKYSEMMEVPFKVIVDKKDLKKMIKNYISYSYILFDTSGITTKDKNYINEMKDFFEFITLPKEIYLCLNASSRFNELNRMMNDFRELHYDRIIITKSDESMTMGPVLSAVYKNSIALSYITNGQDVPSDIALLDNDSFSQILLSEWNRE